MSKTYFITGTASGFGRALAEAVLERGDQAVLTARKPASIDDLARLYPSAALAVPLDVTDAEQRQSAVTAALERFGRVDVLVNNPPRGHPGRAAWAPPKSSRLSSCARRWRSTSLGPSS